jgi:hypothetical protein
MRDDGTDPEFANAYQAHMPINACKRYLLRGCFMAISLLHRNQRNEPLWEDRSRGAQSRIEAVMMRPVELPSESDIRIYDVHYTAGTCHSTKFHFFQY